MSNPHADPDSEHESDDLSQLWATLAPRGGPVIPDYFSSDAYFSSVRESPHLPKILSISFNSTTGGYFAVGMDSGFRLICYRRCPMNVVKQSNFPQNLSGKHKNLCGKDITLGIGIVEILERSNLVALVGGGVHPAFPTNLVIFWDTSEQVKCGELRFQSDVLAIRVGLNRIIVRSSRWIMAFPDNNLGQVRVEHEAPKPGRTTRLLSAHSSQIACIAVGQNGHLIATASIKGTRIKIYDFPGQLIQEVKRGSTVGLINCMTFSANLNWLALTSNNGTVHIFKLKVSPGKSENNFVLPSSKLASKSGNSFY